MKTTIAITSLVLGLSALVAAQLPLRHETFGNQIFQGYGSALAVVEDRNGDGTQDLLVGSPDSGRVDLLSGRDGLLLFSFFAPQAFEAFGRAMAELDDLDGDGLGEIAIGAPLHDAAQANGGDHGRVLVYSSQTGGLLFDVVGDFPGDEFGTTILRWHDLDGDGRDEFVVGAPGTSSPGYARLLDANGGTLSTFHGTTPAGGTGQALARLPDIDGDGLDELAIGSPWADAGGLFACGRLQVVAGNGLSLLLDFPGTSVGSGLGTALATLPDLDGDGHAEILVGAPGDDGFGPDNGTSRVISVASGQVLRSHGGAQAFALSGNALAAVGDADGDGVGDYAIGSWFEDGLAVDSGALRVFSGTSGLKIFERRDAGAGAQLGRAVVGLGDQNGDGFSEFAVGIPRSSVAQVFGGATRVYSVGGYRGYGSALGGAGFDLSLDFLPLNSSLQPSSAPALEGQLVVDGASSFASGLFAVSLAPAAIDIGVLTVLVDPDPALLILQAGFGYDLLGTAGFPVTTKQPFLAGVSLYLQAYVVDFPYAASRGLEMRCLP